VSNKHTQPIVIDVTQLGGLMTFHLRGRTFKN